MTAQALLLGPQRDPNQPLPFIKPVRDVSLTDSGCQPSADSGHPASADSGQTPSADSEQSKVETVPLPFEAMQALVKCRTTAVAHVGTASRRDVVLFRAPRCTGDERQRASALRAQAARHVSHGVLLVVDFDGAGPLSRDDLSALIDIWDQVERVGGVVYLSGLGVESTIQLREAGVGDYFEIRADATTALSDIASRVQS